MPLSSLTRLLAPVAVALCLASTALADQPADPAPPGALAEARAKLDAGRVDEACAILEQSLAKERTSAVLLAAGQCHELQGKTATAYAELLAASTAAEAEGATESQDRARSLASKLVPRLSKLRIDVLAPAGDQVVRRDGVLVPRDDWGKLVFVDPGAHAVTASAAGRRDFSTQVKVGAEGDVRVVLIGELPDVNAKPAPPPAKQPEPVKPPGDGRTETVDPMGVAAFATSGVGLVGMVMGITFGVMALNDVGEAEEDPLLCPNKICSPAGRAVIDEAKTKATVSTVSFVVGGVSLATGITLFLVRELAMPEPKIETKQATIQAVIAPDWSGVRVTF
ncbi:MAG: hypothetical protein JNK04_20940 [Myxococcales bacterium]|nr:hypothetical protein [Myxococcales bacterium]